MKKQRESCFGDHVDQVISGQWGRGGSLESAGHGLTAVRS